MCVLCEWPEFNTRSGFVFLFFVFFLCGTQVSEVCAEPPWAYHNSRFTVKHFLRNKFVIAGSNM